MLVSRCKNVGELKELHAKRANERIASVEDILYNWDYHFCFYDENNKLQICAYIEDDDGKVCLSGFANRKHYNEVIEAIKFMSELMRKDDLYSMTDKKSAILVLTRCGFTKIDDETYFRKAF